MNNGKSYVVDINVLLDDPGALFKLRNGNEKHVFIPYHVLLELNKFKGNRGYAHLVLKGDKSRGPITDMVIKSGLYGRIYQAEIAFDTPTAAIYSRFNVHVVLHCG